MKIINTTNIPTDTLREIIRFCRPSGVGKISVRLTNTIYPFCGRAYPSETGRYGFILLRIGSEKRFPRRFETYQYGQLRGRRYWVADRIEALVYITAHELRHLWQGRKPKRGYAWGSRGRFSEVDSESYAIRKLREWRRK